MRKNERFFDKEKSQNVIISFKLHNLCFYHIISRSVVITGVDIRC